MRWVYLFSLSVNSRQTQTQAHLFLKRAHLWRVPFGETPNGIVEMHPGGRMRAPPDAATKDSRLLERKHPRETWRAWQALAQLYVKDQAPNVFGAGEHVGPLVRILVYAVVMA
jgi:hypothetical protein